MDELVRLHARIDGFINLVRTSMQSDALLGEYATSVAHVLRSMYLADVTCVYLVEDYGATLIGFNAKDDTFEQPEAYVPVGRGLITLGIRGRRTLLFNVEEFDNQSKEAIVIDIASDKRVHTTLGLPSTIKQVLMAPVFSYDHVIALLVVATNSCDLFTLGDIDTLSAAGDYVSSEVTGAIAIAESDRAVELAESASRVAAALGTAANLDESVLRDMSHTISQATGSHTVVFTFDQNDSEASVLYFDTDSFDQSAITISTDLLTNEKSTQGTRTILKGSALGLWAERHTDLNHGVLLTFPLNASHSKCASILALRGASEREFDEVELDFMARLANAVDHALARESKRVDDERISSVLQAGLRNELPRAHGVSSASLYISATSSAVVGGDFFDLYEVDRGRIVVVIGDVSGKGVEAAAMASLIKTALAAYAWEGLDPASMMDALNTLLIKFSRLDRFASLIAVSLDLESGTGTYCSAGHPPALLVHAPRESNAALEVLVTSSPVVGAFEDLVYRNVDFGFDRGDTLFLYTDGTTEARAADGSFYGDAALREVVVRSSRLPIADIPQSVLDDVTRFAQGSIEDDIAMVALRIDGM